MALRGTRIIEPNEAEKYSRVLTNLRETVINVGFDEIIIPQIWSQELFVQKAGPEILNQMYTFQDKKGRDICLIPEVTAIVQDWWKENEKRLKKPTRVFYINRCYRYERPQEGRYREFWQFGAEILGGKSPDDRSDVIGILQAAIRNTGLRYYLWDTAVKRGLNYYVEDGFEVLYPNLGAQKQIAGGGRYEGGIGFAIGIDRLVLALDREGKI